MRRPILAVAMRRPVLAVALASDAAGVSLDEGLHLTRVLRRPPPARRTNQALVMPVRVDRVLQHVEAVRLRHELEWGKEQRAVVLLFPQGLPALQYTARLLDFVVAVIEAFALEQVEQYEGVAGGPRVH